MVSAIYTQFDAQNAENIVQSFQVSNFSGGGMPPDTPNKRGQCGPSSLLSPTLLKLTAYFKLY